MAIEPALAAGRERIALDLDYPETWLALTAFQRATAACRVWTLPAPTACVYRMGYDVTEVRQTDIYARWFAGLRDERARARINVRIRRLSLGNAGDVRPVGEGVSELRIDYGPGYRVYFVRQGPALVVLLAGGDKGTQLRDIATAHQLARGL